MHRRGSAITSLSVRLMRLAFKPIAIWKVSWPAVFGQRLVVDKCMHVPGLSVQRNLNYGTAIETIVGTAWIKALDAVALLDAVCRTGLIWPLQEGSENRVICATSLDGKRIE